MVFMYCLDMNECQSCEKTKCSSTGQKANKDNNKLFHFSMGKEKKKKKKKQRVAVLHKQRGGEEFHD